MTKLSGISFNSTNRLHLVLVIKIYFDNDFNYPKVYTSSKTPGQIKITSQVPNLHVQNQVQLHILNTAGKYTFLLSNFHLIYISN